MLFLQQHIFNPHFIKNIIVKVLFFNSETIYNNNSFRRGIMASSKQIKNWITANKKKSAGLEKDLKAAKARLKKLEGDLKKAVVKEKEEAAKLKAKVKKKAPVRKKAAAKKKPAAKKKTAARSKAKKK